MRKEQHGTTRHWKKGCHQFFSTFILPGPRALSRAFSLRPIRFSPLTFHSFARGLFCSDIRPFSLVQGRFFLRGRPTFSIAPPSSKGVWKGICEYRVSSLEIPSLNAVRSVSRVFSSAFFRCIPKRPPEQQYPAVLSGSRVFFLFQGLTLVRGCF